MQYREYGKTGIKISTLGFGAMRLPADDEYAVECMTRAIDLGVNYIDTALVYGTAGHHERGASEKLVGEAVRARKSKKIYVSTKNPCSDFGPKHWWQRLEASLENLGLSYIDFYVVVHGQGWEGWKKFRRAALKEALRARDEGIIKHLIISMHDKPENMIKVIDDGYVEGIIVQYNLLDRANEPVIAHAHEKGLGVAIMGPVGGGRLGMTSQKLTSVIESARSTPELALRFVLSNPNVTCALSGMNTIEMVEENCAVASRKEPLSAQEKAAIQETLEKNKRLMELYCTGCGYCMPCPQGVGIPQIFSAMNLHRVWGLTELAKQQYAKLGPDNRDGLLQADACIECGACEQKCPQNIPIIQQLKESHKALSS